MASVAQQIDLAAWIDKSLDYLMSNWDDIPEIAADWDNWDEDDRLDFVLEWPLREDRLHQLQRWQIDGNLSASQLQRFAELEELIERNTPTLGHLLEDESAIAPGLAP
ncbi:MAG: hypothetical protein H0V00_08860 [Chloroflexia bacterium]|nr:hypothetical protein [Chloroflexia bacterium]